MLHNEARELLVQGYEATHDAKGIAKAYSVSKWLSRRAIVPAESISEAGTKILPPITPKRWESKGGRPPWQVLEDSVLEVLTLTMQFRDSDNHLQQG